MNEIHTIVVGLLNMPPFDKCFDQIRRVFAVKGIAPTCDTCGGAELSPRFSWSMISSNCISTVTKDNLLWQQYE